LKNLPNGERALENFHDRFPWADLAYSSRNSTRKPSRNSSAFFSPNCRTNSSHNSEFRTAARYLRVNSSSTSGLASRIGNKQWSWPSWSNHEGDGKVSASLLSRIPNPGSPPALGPRRFLRPFRDIPRSHLGATGSKTYNTHYSVPEAHHPVQLEQKSLEKGRGEKPFSRKVFPAFFSLFYPPKAGRHEVPMFRRTTSFAPKATARLSGRLQL
jgi:hypothetical protein